MTTITQRGVFGSRSTRDSMKSVPCLRNERFSVRSIVRLIVKFMLLVGTMEIMISTAVRSTHSMKMYGEKSLQ